MYAGTIEGIEESYYPPYPPAKVFRYEGGNTWTFLGELGNASYVNSLIVYGSTLYAGTDAGVFRYDGLDEVTEEHIWTNVGPNMNSLVVYDSKLYGGTCHSTLEGLVAKVYRYDGYHDGEHIWTEMPELGDADCVESLAVYNDDLYAGTTDTEDVDGDYIIRGHVYRYDDEEDMWINIGQLGDSGYVNSLVVYDGELFGAADKVYRYDGEDEWISLGQLGDALYVESLAVYNSKLYAGTYYGGFVYRYDAGWTNLGRVGNGCCLPSLAVYESKLYAGIEGGNFGMGKVYRYDGETGCWALIESQKQDLADRFSPYLYFYNGFPKEKFRPTTIEDMLNNSGLWVYSSGIVDINYPQSPAYRTKIHGKPVTPEFISNYQNGGIVYYYLDLLDDESGDYDKEMLEEIAELEEERNKLYARVTCDEYEGKMYVVIQYWFFYLYNDFDLILLPDDDHEGEWEMIEVLLDSKTLEPIGAAYSRHWSGEYRIWPYVRKLGNHPKVYVARDSHAAYFKEGIYYYGLAVDLVDNNKELETPSPYIIDPYILESDSWLYFGGNWGYVWGQNYPDYMDGPLGPMYQPNDKWDDPAGWAFQYQNNPPEDVNPPLMILSLASPADMLITNSQGQKLGYINGEFVQEIPNSYVNSLDEEEIYPIPANDVYTVQIFGTGDGVFNFAYELESWNQGRMLFYTNVPVNPSTVATMKIGESITDYEMEMDNDGDGIVDEIVNPNMGVSLTSPNTIQSLQSRMNFEITIKNEGTSLDTFNLESLLPDNCVGNFSQSSVTLNAGESSTITFSVSTPTDVQVQDYTMIVTASSQTDPGLSASLMLSPSTQSRRRVDTTKPMKSLAQTNISKVRDLNKKAEALLKKAKESGFETRECEELYEKAIEFLEKAEKFYKGRNYIAANNYALKALELFEEVIECLEELG